MAGGTTRRNASMVHRPVGCGKAANIARGGERINMAYFARNRGRNVIPRFTHYHRRAYRRAGVARGTT